MLSTMHCDGWRRLHDCVTCLYSQNDCVTCNHVMPHLPASFTRPPSIILNWGSITPIKYLYNIDVM